MMKAMRVLALLLAAVLPGVFPTSVHAQQPPEVIPAPRFDITRFDVTGNTLLPAEEVEQPGRALYRQRQGFRRHPARAGSARAGLPRPRLRRGAGPPAGAGHHARRRAVPRAAAAHRPGDDRGQHPFQRREHPPQPALGEGRRDPNSREIARNLQLAAEHPVKQTNVLLRSGASEETVDVNVKVTDDKPWRRFVTLDNTGTSDTGNFRWGWASSTATFSTATTR